MIVKLLTEHHLEFLSFKEAAQARLSLHLSRMPHCWNSHAMAYFFLKIVLFLFAEHYPVVSVHQIGFYSFLCLRQCLF